MPPQERLKILREAKPNSWLAFSQDESRFLAEGVSYAEVVAIAEKSGESDPVLLKVPEQWLPLVL